MDIIPVIDLKGGKAVRAVGAQGRAAYRPLQSPLCPDGDPLDAARGYLSLYPFSRLYVADLDGIETGAVQDLLLQRIRNAFPDLELWVDNGLHHEAACRAWLAKGLGRLVLGSETQRETGLAPRLGAVLSLDFRGGVFLGPASLLDAPELWPEQVIAMALHEIGAARGPDIALLQRLQRLAPHAALYVAGGVRDAADLDRLAALGVRGALVATALHAGALTAADLAGLRRRPSAKRQAGRP